MKNLCDFMQTLGETFFRICCFLLKIVYLLFVLLIAWYFIVMLSSLTTMQGEIVPGGERGTIIIMGFVMTIFYLPLCNFVKSLFPSISSGKHRNYEKLVILIFYLFIVATSIPILNEKISMRAAARESEAKQYIRSMNRAQEAIFEDKSAFATSVDALGIGIKTETINFKYSVNVNKQAAFNYGVSKHEEVKSYIGGVFLRKSKQNNKTDKITTESILCRADQRGTITPLPPTIENGKLFCGNGTTEVTRL